MMYGLTNFRRRDRDLFRLFDDFEKNYFGFMREPLTQMRTDIRDEGDQFVLEADLPGFNKEEVTVEVENGKMTISAYHSDEKEEKEGEANNYNYICRERRYGSFSRSFDLSGIDEENIAGGFQDGVLKLTLPKVKAVEPEKKKIALE